jgi:Tetratricopeptide repeat
MDGLGPPSTLYEASEAYGALWDAGKYREVVRAWEAVRDKAEAECTSASTDCALAEALLGCALLLAGQPEDAKRPAKRAYNTVRALKLGEDHLVYCQVYLCKSRVDLARDMPMRASVLLGLCVRALRAHHPQQKAPLAVALLTLGGCYATSPAQGEADFAMAASVREESVRLAEEGKDSVLVSVACHNLAYVYGGLRRDQEAQTLLDRSMSTFSEARGIDHPFWNCSVCLWNAQANPKLQRTYFSVLWTFLSARWAQFIQRMQACYTIWPTRTFDGNSRAEHSD